MKVETSSRTALAIATVCLLTSELVGEYFINEIIAQLSSVSRLHPRVRTIIEMGGEDSKLDCRYPGGWPV